jgi:hypothetical protein
MPRLSASAAVRCASLRLWSVAYSQLWPDGLGQDPHDDRCVGGHARAGALCSDDSQTPCHICTGTGLTTVVAFLPNPPAAHAQGSVPDSGVVWRGTAESPSACP